MIVILCHILIALFYLVSKGKPRLSSSKTTPVDGEDVHLTCHTQDKDVTQYQFYNNGQLIAPASESNTMDMRSVTTSQTGVYTCCVFLESLMSDASDHLYFKGKIW